MTFIDYSVQVLQLSSLIFPFSFFFVCLIISKLLCQQLFFERGNISLLLWNTIIEHIDSTIQLKEAENSHWYCQNKILNKFQLKLYNHVNWTSITIFYFLYL